MQLFGSTLVRLCHARDLIHDFHDEPLSLAEGAEEAGLSAWHFLRAFRATFGETPHAYLTRLRIEHAQRLLASGRPVTDVCFDVGYFSLGTFSTLFKRHVGLSPTDFRRRIRGWITVPTSPLWVFIPCCFAHRFGGPSPPTAISEKYLASAPA